MRRLRWTAERFRVIVRGWVYRTGHEPIRTRNCRGIPGRIWWVLHCRIVEFFNTGDRESCVVILSVRSGQSVNPDQLSIPVELHINNTLPQGGFFIHKTRERTYSAAIPTTCYTVPSSSRKPHPQIPVDRSNCWSGWTRGIPFQRRSPWTRFWRLPRS